MYPATAGMFSDCAIINKPYELKNCNTSILLLNELSFEKLLVTHVGRRLNPITKIKLSPARFSRVVTDCITIREKK